MLKYLSVSNRKTSFLCTVGCMALFSGVLGAEESISQKSTPVDYKIGPTLEAKVGYFFFVDSTMRDVYDEGGLDLQISGSYPVIKWARRYALNVYASVEYLQRTGTSLSGNQNTSIWEIPVNVGLKPVIAITNEFQYYFAVGPRYFYIHQHYNSEYLPKNNHRNGIGLFVNTGFNFIFWRHLLVDVFGEYSYAQTKFHASSDPLTYTKTTQVGGFTFGGGLGYSF
jgi:hypothetical protein